VGRVLIDNDDPVRRLGNDLGLVKLRPGDAQGMVAGRSFSSPIVGSACSGAAGGVSSPVGGA